MTDGTGRVVHPSEELEFATIHPTLSPISVASHPSEQLEFITALDIEDEKGGPKHIYTEDIAEAGSSSSGSHDKSLKPSDTLSRTASNDAVYYGLKNSVPNLRALVNESRAAAIVERQMGFIKGVKLYPKAIAWSALLSCTLVMEGYDLSIINGFYALPQFVRRYGRYSPKLNDYEITAAWQAGLTNGAVVGEILGLLSNGILTEKYGYRRTLLAALAWLMLTIFLAFFAFHIRMLLVAEILCGLSWGVFQTLATTYAAEVMPVTLRAYLTSNVNLCWLIGQFVGSGVLRGTVSWRDDWSFRIPFGLQWMWAVPIIVGVFFAPESPWWLVRNERYDDAKKSLLRLTSRGQDFNPDQTVSMMRHTNEVEKYLTSGTSYWDCFKGTDLRRTEIGCMVWAIQVLSGSPMTGYAAYFFTRAGFGSERAYDLSIAMYGVAIIAQMMSWVSMRYIGRRTLYTWGTGVCAVVMLIGGIIGTLPESTSQSWGLAILLVIATFVYDSTIGPVCYSLVGEIPSTRLRVKTVVIGRIMYNIVTIITNVLVPEMLNPLAWDLGGKAMFLFAATSIASFIWCYYRLPEPKGLTYMELDILFEKKADARKFKKLQVNLARTGYFSISQPGAGESHWHGEHG